MKVSHHSPPSSFHVQKTEHVEEMKKDAAILTETLFVPGHIMGITPSKVIGKELVKYAQLENVRYFCICIPIHCSQHGLQEEDASNWQKLLISILRNVHTLKQEASQLESRTTATAASATTDNANTTTMNLAIAEEFHRMIPIICPVFYHCQEDGILHSSSSSFKRGSATVNSLKSWLMSHFPDTFEDENFCLHSGPAAQFSHGSIRIDPRRRSSSASTVAWYPSQFNTDMSHPTPFHQEQEAPSIPVVKMACARKVYYPINDKIFQDHHRYSDYHDQRYYNRRNSPGNHNFHSNLSGCSSASGAGSPMMRDKNHTEILEDCAVPFYLLPMLHLHSQEVDKGNQHMGSSKHSPIDWFFQSLCCSLGNTVDYVMLIHGQENGKDSNNVGKHGFVLESNALSSLWKDLIVSQHLNAAANHGRCLMSVLARPAIAWPSTSNRSAHSIESGRDLTLSMDMSELNDFTPCKSSFFDCLRGKHHYYGPSPPVHKKKSSMSSTGQWLLNPQDRRDKESSCCCCCCRSGCGEKKGKTDQPGFCWRCYLSFLCGPALLQGYACEVSTVIDDLTSCGIQSTVNVSVGGVSCQLIHWQTMLRFQVMGDFSELLFPHPAHTLTSNRSLHSDQPSANRRVSITESSHREHSMSMEERDRSSSVNNHDESMERLEEGRYHGTLLEDAIYTDDSADIKSTSALLESMAMSGIERDRSSSLHHWNDSTVEHKDEQPSVIVPALGHPHPQSAGLPLYLQQSHPQQQQQPPTHTSSSFSLRTTLISASSNSPLLPASPRSNYSLTHYHQYPVIKRDMSLSQHHIFYPDHGMPISPPRSASVSFGGVDDDISPMPTPRRRSASYFDRHMTSPHLTTPLNPSNEHEQRRRSHSIGDVEQRQSRSGEESINTRQHMRVAPAMKPTLAQQRAIVMSSLQHHLRCHTWDQMMHVLMNVCTPIRCEGTRQVNYAILHINPETTWQGYLLQQQTSMQSSVAMWIYFQYSKKVKSRLKTRNHFSAASPSPRFPSVASSQTTSTSSSNNFFATCVGSITNRCCACFLCNKKRLSLIWSQWRSAHEGLIMCISPAIAGITGYISIHSLAHTSNDGANALETTKRIHEMFQWATDTCLWHINHRPSWFIRNHNRIASSASSSDGMCMMHVIDLYLMVAFVIFMYWTLTAHVIDLIPPTSIAMGSHSTATCTTGGSARLSGRRTSLDRASSVSSHPKESTFGRWMGSGQKSSSSWVFEVICHILAIVCVCYVIPIYMWIGKFLVQSNNNDITTVEGVLKGLLLLFLFVPFMTACIQHISHNQNHPGTNRSHSSCCTALANAVKIILRLLTYCIVYGCLAIMQNVFVPYFGMARLHTLTTATTANVVGPDQKTNETIKNETKKQIKRVMKRWNLLLLWLLLMINMVVTILAINLYFYYRGQEQKHVHLYHEEGEGIDWMMLIALSCVIFIFCFPLMQYVYLLVKLCGNICRHALQAMCRLCSRICCCFCLNSHTGNNGRTSDSHDNDSNRSSSHYSRHVDANSCRIQTSNHQQHTFGRQQGRQFQPSQGQHEPWGNIRVTVTDEDVIPPSPSLSISVSPSPAVSPCRTSPQYRVSGRYTHNGTVSPQIRSCIKQSQSPTKNIILEHEEHKQDLKETEGNDDRDEVESKTDSDIPWFQHPNHQQDQIAPKLSSLVSTDKEITSHGQMNVDINVVISINDGQKRSQNETTRVPSQVILRTNDSTLSASTTSTSYAVQSELSPGVTDGHTTGVSVNSQDDSHRHPWYNGSPYSHLRHEIPAMGDFRYNEEPALTIHHLPIFSPTISPTNNPLE